ncbi:hypothetical protein TUM4438_37830 [Shewanella sairae]|uniref:Lipoprotein n=1 Tax=Shewanella sairae TaxID=190310 RepID=A0ABQ4PPK0_9GAMM|nr:hypothetical protein [Shewanella sairae]MCL1130854.1 hypothetical protein [Shewanella sairae]GIU50740.1 hypothetical protein TUM4438_37830 [Shewanella sairae]
MNIQFNTLLNRPTGLMVCFTLLLTACGGGGDDSGAATPAPVATTPAPATTTPDPDPAPTPTSLDDLIVDADNKLQSAYTLTVDIDKGNSNRGYFSLCDDYQANGGGYKVNFNSCLFRGPLTKGKLSKDIKVANHESQLIAVIWFYDGQAPQFVEWSYLQGEDSQVLTMN